MIFNIYYNSVATSYWINLDSSIVNSGIFRTFALRRRSCSWIRTICAPSRPSKCWEIRLHLRFTKTSLSYHHLNALFKSFSIFSSHMSVKLNLNFQVNLIWLKHSFIFGYWRSIISLINNYHFKVICDFPLL